MASPTSSNESVSYLHSSIISDSSQDLAVSEKRGYESNISVPYLKTIRKCKSLFNNPKFEIQTSIEELRIKSITNDQLEMLIQTDSLRSIFKDMEKTLRLIGSLRYLSRNRLVISQCFSKEDAARIKKILDLTSHYQSQSEITSISSPVYAIFLDLMQSKRVELFIGRFPNKLQSKRIMHFIKSLNRFYSMLENSLMLTAKETRKKIEYLRDHLANQLVRKSQIDSMNERLLEAEMEHNAKIERLEKEKMKYNIKIIDLQERNKSIIEYMEAMSRKSMTLQVNMSEIIIERVKEEAEVVSENYEKCFAEHLKTESVMRAQRFKIETKLVSWISKYDTVMLEKQAEIDEVTEAKDAEFEEFLEIQCLFNEQNKVYKKYRKQYDKEEEERQNAIDVFTLIRATKIIQRWWRVHYKRILKLRKLRKAMRKRQGSAKRKTPPKGLSPKSPKSPKSKKR